jgi:hypothetical protein
MASVVDTLITHPNVMNGASLYWPISNALYVEGHTLDMFAEGSWGLLPLRNGGHRIGLLLDKALSPDLITRHLHAADAARATLASHIIPSSIISLFKCCEFLTAVSSASSIPWL